MRNSFGAPIDFLSGSVESSVVVTCEAMYHTLSNGSLIDPTRAPYGCSLGASLVSAPSAALARAYQASTSSTYIMKTDGLGCHCPCASPISTTEVPTRIDACRTTPSGERWTA